jgi:hypothetical protein
MEIAGLDRRHPRSCGGAAPREGYDSLLEVVMENGSRTAAGQRSLQASNRHFEEQWSKLPGGLLRLTDPDRYSVRPSARLRHTASEVDAQREEE